MKKKFKTKKRSVFVFKIVVVLFCVYLLSGFIFDGKVINIKELLLNSSLNNIVSEENYLLKLVDINIKSPENIIYSSLNKMVSKEDLSVFNMHDVYDSYENNNSVYVEEINETPVSNPIVYIYNTHQLEEYSEEVFNDYNIVPNVMIAAYTLKEFLIKDGIPSIVETNNIKEYLNNNSLTYYHSYRASKHFTIDAMNKNPDLNYFIDLHRDSAPLSVTLLEANEKRYARVLFVIGTDNPTYQKNLNFAYEINNRLESKLPGISRGVLEQGDGSGDYIYNQDIHPNMIILEMGGVDNKIEEVYNTLEIVSEVLSEIINEGVF